jgi:hypothetical protein
MFSHNENNTKQLIEKKKQIEQLEKRVIVKLNFSYHFICFVLLLIGNGIDYINNEL